jgi:hypothetical protein
MWIVGLGICFLVIVGNVGLAVLGARLVRKAARSSGKSWAWRGPRLAGGFLVLVFAVVVGYFAVNMLLLGLFKGRQ